METVTLITEEDVAVGALVDTVSGTLPAGKRFLSATVVSLPGATDELGVNGTLLNGTTLTTQLRGSDSTAGQHLIRYAYAEDLIVEAAIADTPFVSAAQYTVETSGWINSCSCPCAGAAGSPAGVGERLTIYVTGGESVEAIIISANRDLAPGAGNKWTYVLGVEEDVLVIDKTTLKCISCSCC